MIVLAANGEPALPADKAEIAAQLEQKLLDYEGLSVLRSA
jgi:hypothetical protein